MKNRRLTMTYKEYYKISNLLDDISVTLTDIAIIQKEISSNLIGEYEDAATVSEKDAIAYKNYIFSNVAHQYIKQTEEKLNKAITMMTALSDREK